MISFGLLTSTPIVARDFFIARGVMKLEGGELVGVRPGVEWVETQNTIALSGAGTEADPWVYDTRRLFHLKVAHEAEADETEGEVQDDRLIWQRTKLGKWIAANSAAANATDALGRTFRGRKVTGQSIWLIREDDMAQLHAWQ